MRGSTSRWTLTSHPRELFRVREVEWGLDNNGPSWVSAVMALSWSQTTYLLDTILDWDFAGEGRGVVGA